METNWITLSAADLNAYEVAAMVTAAREEALADGQGDPFDEVMPDVVARVRDDIRGCATNQVSALANSIPKGLRAETIYLIIEKMVPRLHLPLTRDMVKLIEKAEERLALVRDCKIPVEKPSDPLDPTDVQSLAGSPRICKPKRRFDRCAQEGI